MAIAVKLDDLLHDRRMTLTELAERIDITLANLSILKTGKARAIRFSTLEAICAALDASRATSCASCRTRVTRSQRRRTDVSPFMSSRRKGRELGWAPEPTYPKPDISVRATTLYYQIVAPLMLPTIESRLLNLFRCRQQACFFQRSRAHPPSGRDFQAPVRFAAVGQKNGRTEDYLYVTGADGIVACARVQNCRIPWLGKPRRSG